MSYKCNGCPTSATGVSQVQQVSQVHIERKTGCHCKSACFPPANKPSLKSPHSVKLSFNHLCCQDLGDPDRCFLESGEQQKIRLLHHICGLSENWENFDTVAREHRESWECGQ